MSTIHCHLSTTFSHLRWRHAPTGILCAGMKQVGIFIGLSSGAASFIPSFRIKHTAGTGPLPRPYHGAAFPAIIVNSSPKSPGRSSSRGL